MGLLPNPLRRVEPSLPTYEQVDNNKEHFSDDDYTSDGSDDESIIYERYASTGSSRNTSGSLSSSGPMLPRVQPSHPPQRQARRIYPYRLPTKVTRYLCLVLGGTVFLMILSLIRASQMENWMIESGKFKDRPRAPHKWEQFPFLERYYGGIRTLEAFNESTPEYPQTDETVSPHDAEDNETQRKRALPESKPWQRPEINELDEDMRECFVDQARKVRIPPVRYYNGRPKGFPRHVVGSYEVLGLHEEICLERFGRYGPYGFGYSLRSGGLGTGETGESEGSATVWQDAGRVDYRDVDWADVQRRCYSVNKDRFEDLPPRVPELRGFHIGDQSKPRAASALAARDLHSKDAVHTTGAPADTTPKVKAAPQPAQTSGVVNDLSAGQEAVSQKKARTAVVIRCWDEYAFHEDDIANVRSMISELALASGGRYDIHLLVQVKNEARNPVWADHEAYEARIREAVPKEFQGLVTLWTETQMLALYQGVYDNWSRGPDLPVHGVYRGLSMAMQHFAYMHPEYEHFWQWEMDVRYTGHYYDFFTKLEQWAKDQPRKGLWERNSRFYFPDVHGSWEDFHHMSRVQTEMGAVSADTVWSNVPGMEQTTTQGKSVWGPVRPNDRNDWFQPKNDTLPPHSFEKDKGTWGKGEEADLITLNPIFDPEGTTWGLKDDITGYNRSEPLPPRRAAIITTSRMSRRLLLTMHKMTAYKKQFAFPEMWPATVALQHGYKAVYAPHPVYVDRAWPLDYMKATYNAGRDGSSGGGRTSIFGDREHNMHGTSWFYNSGFSPNLYRRWLGLKVNNDGGEEFETTEDKSKKGPGVGNMRGGEGRMCLPPMLLHPVKDVELPIEAPPKEDVSTGMTDPSA